MPSELAAPERPDEHALNVRRRRAGLLVALVVLAASSFGLGVMAAPNPAPPDRAARLVPADALLYVHTTIGRDQDRRLLATAERFAAFRTLRDRALKAIAPLGDVRPWLGDEAALALLPGDQPLLVASVRDRRKAQAMLARAQGATKAALVGGFVLVGSEPAIRAALHRRAALADAPSFRQAARDRPSDRTLDAYATATALHDLLPQRLQPLLENRPGLEAVGATLAAADHGARLRLRAVGGAGAGTAQTFEPKLIERLPSGAAAYIGLAGGSELLGLARHVGLGPLLDVLQGPADREAGVDLQRDLIGPLKGEVALAAWSRDGAPVAALAATTRDPRRTRETLARLQTPVALRLGPPEGPEPFQAKRIGGEDTFSLPATPLLQPSYGLDHDTAILATHPSALARQRASLAENPHFGRVLPSISQKAEALVFLDLRQLLALGVLTGAVAPGLSADLADLRLVRAAGAVIKREKADTTAELFLEIP